MKNIKLTKKQELVLNYIKKYTAEHGFPPAVREIAKGVGLNSPSSVHSHIKRLERDGFIKKTNAKFRTLEVVGINEFNVKNEEAIKLPLYKDYNLTKHKETYSYPADRIPKNEEIFALIVNEDTEDFRKEDILIITKPKSYNKFDIVLLLKDGMLQTHEIINKNEEFDENTVLLGKLIELSRKF